MAGLNKLRMCACLLNISEARRAHIVDQVASAALKVNDSSHSQSATKGVGKGHPITAAVLNVFQDYDYNRSVITIVSSADTIGASVYEACCTAYDLIDLQRHEGGHPRLGAVDLVPIHPLSSEVTLQECGVIARDIATKLTAAVPGCSVFLFGAADLPQCRGLVARRKAVRWYAGRQHSKYGGIRADIGPDPTPRHGLTGIGAIPYVMNCNVTLDTNDVTLGRDIAAAIRDSAPGGLPGVQAMAFAHEGTVEIACNVEAIHDETGAVVGQHGDNVVCSFGRYYHVPPGVVTAKVAALGRGRVRTAGTALVGFTPEEAQRLAAHVLSNGHQEYWRDRTARMM